jgi:hypothetical protein
MVRWQRRLTLLTMRPHDAKKDTNLLFSARVSLFRANTISANSGLCPRIKSQRIALSYIQYTPPPPNSGPLVRGGSF